MDGVTGWWIECKVGRPAKQPHAALSQAEADSDGRAAVAICKEDRKEPMAFVRLGVLSPTCSPEDAGITCSISFADWLEIASKGVK